MPFVKLDCRILDSSIWIEPSDVRVCWITLLAMADANGLVESTAPGISRRACLSLESTRRALEIFEGPDSDSKNPENEGRRIRRVSGGYLILNYEAYRKKDHTAYARLKRYRENKKMITSNHHNQSESASKNKKINKGESIKLFEAFWIAYPQKVGKGAAEKAWQALKPDAELVEKMLRALEWQRQQDQWTKDGGQFIPNPSTWLNQRRWEDEPRPVRSSLQVGAHRPEIDQEPQRDPVAAFLAHFPEDLAPLRADFEAHYKNGNGGAELIEKLLDHFKGGKEMEAKVAYFLHNLQPAQRTPEIERKYRFNYIVGKYNVPEIPEEQEKKANDPRS